MKPLILLLLLSCCQQRVSAQAGNDLAAEGLNGRVKIVTETEYLDEAMKQPFMKTVDRYDLKGNLIESIHNDYVLKLNSVKRIKYDTDKNGMVIKRNEFDDIGRRVRVVAYKYDRLNHITEEEDHRYYDNREIVYRNEYYYDGGHNKRGEINYTNGVQERSAIYTYDGKERVDTVKWYKNANLAGYNAYYYRGSTQWVICQKQTDTISIHIFRTLDTAGWVVEKTTYTGDYSKKTTEANLTFDSHGNWLTQSITGTMTENYYAARKIEYYE